MRIYEDIDASDFRDRCWSGAVDTVEALTDDQIETIFNMYDDNGDGASLTELNDFFWFERDTIAEWLGYTDWEQLEARGDKGNDYFDSTDFNIRITHGNQGVDDNYSIESLLDDLKSESNGEYEIDVDWEEDYDDDAEKYTGYVDAWVSEAIVDQLKEDGISYEDI